MEDDAVSARNEDPAASGRTGGTQLDGPTGLDVCVESGPEMVSLLGNQAVDSDLGDAKRVLPLRGHVPRTWCNSRTVDDGVGHRVIFASLESAPTELATKGRIDARD